MIKFLAIGLLLHMFYGASLPPGRIVGGEPADISEAPYIVALLYDNLGIGRFSLVCGGSIISSTVIVTAAHCIQNTRENRWMIRAGSALSDSGGQTVGIANFRSHSSFNSFLDYDIALIYLSSPNNINNVNTALVNLPPTNLEVEDDSSVFAAGWGALTSGGSDSLNLQKVTLNVVNQEECRRTYFDYNPVTTRMICAGNQAGGQGVCSGDSGGPLMFEDTLVGLTSWGRGCAVALQPGVFTRVSTMINWIDQNMPS